MNWTMVARLIWKDWYLNRGWIAAALAGGIATLAFVGAMRGTQIAMMLGTIVAATILIGMGALVTMSAATERKEQTLPFAMSLPVSHLEYTASKLLGGLLIFFVLWAALVVGIVGTILLAPGFPHGLIPFAVIMSVEILMSTCLIAVVAVVTESLGWTVGSTQIGALSLNGVGWWTARLPGIRGTMNSPNFQWSGTATALVAGELAVMVLMIAIAFAVQARKQDFV